MALKELIQETIKEEKYIQEAFSDKNLEKVATLLASLASKKLPTGKFVPFLGDWYADEFIVNGQKGKGYRFLSENGYMIRFGFVKPKTKAKTLKEKFVINRVDYWEPNGQSKFNLPTKTVLLDPWLNIVDVVDEIFDALKNGVTESKIEESQIVKKMLAYAKYKGVDDDTIADLKTTHKLKKYLQDNGLWDDAEYKGFKVKKGSVEKDNPEKDLKEVEKKIQKVKYADPKIVFKDIEKLTKLIALNVLKQNGLIITGAPGMGKCRFGTELINIEGI
jgi:hypothetical protein